MNVGIILAAGNSSRFNNDTPKQLYKINGESVISYSVDALNLLDKVIIVTNKDCYKEIKKEFPKTKILINNVNSRLKSIKTALDYLKNKPVNIVIHDAARPFITQEHIQTLIDSSKTYLYSQYYLKLTNGLLRKNGNAYEVIDREQYIELCTPLIADYKLYSTLFNNFIDVESPTTCEILPLADLFKVKYNLIEGHHKYLRKITTLDDV